MSNRQTLTEDEIRTITSRIRDGTATDAEEVTLFEGMAPFIRRIGEKFSPSLRCPDEVDDLQQEAFPALLEAGRRIFLRVVAELLSALGFFRLHRPAERSRTRNSRPAAAARTPGK